MNLEQVIIKLKYLVGANGLISETKVIKLLGITSIYYEQIKTKLEIQTIKVPRILKGQRCFDYKKTSLQQALKIVDYLERNKKH